jgi:hypothetical protein
MELIISLVNVGTDETFKYSLLNGRLFKGFTFPFVLRLLYPLVMRVVSWALNQTHGYTSVSLATLSSAFILQSSGYTINYEPMTPYHTSNSPESNTKLYTKILFRCENYKHTKLF